MSSATTSAPAPTNTSVQNSGGGGGKPLLFFVALGFGVVFTNLWIIVGVKYCFRYNRRARALAALGQDENGDPIDLAALTRPRRRRERKLMTMDEVNERFPLTKYKVWRATREQEGLPAAGGVTAPSSRAGSVTDTMHTVNEKGVDEKGEPKSTRPVISTMEVADSSAHVQTLASTRLSTTSQKDFAAPDPISETEQESHQSPSSKPETTSQLHDVPLGTVTETAPTPQDSISASAEAEDEEDDDDDSPIAAAAPLTTTEPGDACAICIDTLEDDDEIRGLTCGHAFHAGCIDPWLTSRRASCPLCKADYYVPKPRADRDPNAPNPDAAPNPFGERIAPPVAAPSYAFLGRSGRRANRAGGGGGRGARQRTYIMGGRFATVTMDEESGGYDWRNVNYAGGGAMPAGRHRHAHLAGAQQQQQQRGSEQTSGGGGLGSRLMGWSLFGRGRDAPSRPRRGDAGTAAAAAGNGQETGQSAAREAEQAQTQSPGMLEAGLQPMGAMNARV